MMTTVLLWTKDYLFLFRNADVVGCFVCPLEEWF